jgi:dUTP pyrophosphatase
MLQVKKFHPDAILPTVAHPVADLGYDLYTVEEVVLQPGQMTEVRTGIGVCFTAMAVGFLVKDRSSFAKKRLVTSGGVIDAGYRGEIIVFMENRGLEAVTLSKGQKFAQMIPLPTLTRLKVEEVEELPPSERGEGGFGSSDKPKLIVPENKIVVAP